VPTSAQREGPATLKGTARGRGGNSVAPDLVCFSHLRWDFVYQRPNHLMARAARDRRVYFVEEPLIGRFTPSYRIERRDDGLRIVLPYLPESLDDTAMELELQTLIRELVASEEIHDPIAWYYTPMALPFTRWLRPRLTVYDAMDELSAFLGAPPLLLELEEELLERADVIFTGGNSLYEAKRERHANVHAMPSSVDARHFATARNALPDQADQAAIMRPRIGWFGVIDERMDLELLQRTAALRPDWSFVLIGPVVKIDPAFIPRRANIHLLGPKPYDELPMYISGWDVAMMPFARNEATRFISPTKTLEYLAAGRAVVSTSIRDVTSPYGEQGLVAIADDPDAFVAAIDRALVEDPVSRQERADAWLAGLSWDATWARMRQLIEVAERARMPAAEEGPATHGVLTNGRSWTRDVRTAAEAAQQ